jgi:hypothetical protein
MGMSRTENGRNLESAIVASEIGMRSETSLGSIVLCCVVLCCVVLCCVVLGWCEAFGPAGEEEKLAGILNIGRSKRKAP